MWSEVMDVDAFAAFKEAGDPIDPDAAARLEKFILSAVGSEPALSGKPRLAPIDQSGLRTLTPARLLDAARRQARNASHSRRS